MPLQKHVPRKSEAAPVGAMSRIVRLGPSRSGQEGPSSAASYGFIRPDAGERDVFCHASNCYGETPHIRDRVTYTVGIDQRKGRPCALDVRMEGDDSVAAPGMYGVTEETSGGALAEGLNKLLRDR